MSWKIGNVKVSKVIETKEASGFNLLLPQATADLVSELDWLVPAYAATNGALKQSVHSIVLETRDKRIVVDTGFGNDKQGRYVAAWNNMQTPFLQRMIDAGYPADTIDMVICTHLHVDHVGWNTKLIDGKWLPTFENAHYLFGTMEFEYWRHYARSETHKAVFADSVEPIAKAGMMHLIPIEHQLTDEIRIIPTPGHSPGHMSIHIASEGQEALLLGDVAHHPVQMHYLNWSSKIDFDGEQSARTRKNIFSRFADRPVLLIGGHFSDGYIKRCGDHFKFRHAGHLDSF